MHCISAECESGHSLVTVLWRSSYGHTATLLCPYDPLPEQLTGHYSHPRDKKQTNIYMVKRFE